MVLDLFPPVFRASVSFSTFLYQKKFFQKKIQILSFFFKILTRIETITLAEILKTSCDNPNHNQNPQNRNRKPERRPLYSNGSLFAHL